MFDYLNQFLLFNRRSKRNGMESAMRIKNMNGVLIFNQLCAEWCSRFKWEYDGEKQSIATGLIERTILLNDMCGFSDKWGEWRNFVPSAVECRSFYAQESRLEGFDYVGRTQGIMIPVQIEDNEITVSDFVSCAVIRDNLDGTSPIFTILNYTERLLDIEIRIRAAIKNIIGTTIISGTEEQVRDIERQRRANDLGVPYLIKIDDIDIVNGEPKIVQSVEIPEKIQTLFESRDKVHADFLQSIGVRVNNEMNKKSGTTPMEIIENRQNVDLVLNQELETRKHGIKMCERIGLTGLSVKLDNFKSLIGNYDKNGNLISPEGGMEYAKNDNNVGTDNTDGE